MTVTEPRAFRSSAVLVPGAAPRVASTSSRSGWPGSASPDSRRGVMRCHSVLSGSGDRSGRSRIVLSAVPASSAISWPALPVLARLASVTAVTPGAPVIAPVTPGGSGPAESTRTSEPTAKAAWSAVDCRQLAYPASASVVVAVAITTSRTGPAWRIGRLAICQLTIAAASRRSWSVALSASLASSGSPRSGMSATPASASAGARATPGSIPSDPVAGCETAE